MSTEDPYPMSREDILIKAYTKLTNLEAVCRKAHICWKCGRDLKCVLKKDYSRQIACSKHKEVSIWINPQQEP